MAGEFGKFYGNIDGMTIVYWLNDFCERFRGLVILQEDGRREQARQEEMRKHHITYEEYVRSKRAIGTTASINHQQ